MVVGVVVVVVVPWSLWADAEWEGVEGILWVAQRGLRHVISLWWGFVARPGLASGRRKKKTISYIR